MTENEYYKNPRICPNCGTIIKYEKRNNVGCCKSCSIAIGNRKRGHLSDLHKLHISEKLNKHKIKYCKFCGQPLNENYDHYVCKKYRIFHSLEKFGFNKNVIGTIDLFNEYNRIKKIIENWYLLNGSDEQLLKQDFNYLSGSANFHKILKSLNIKSNNHSDSIKKAYLDGKISISSDEKHYKTEWHTTWNGKEVYLRSSYEIEYAKKLDEQKVDYDVECLRIKYFNTQTNDYRCAIPDFYIPSENMIIEIKSSWTLDEQEMKDKMKTYDELGYKVKVICDYKEIQL